MMKDSEWGAVVYLAQSSFGRDGLEITKNDYYTNNESPFKTIVTGLASSDSSSIGTQSLSNVSAYNTEAGMKGSTTGNITGIYDLSGGSHELVSTYICFFVRGGNAINTELPEVQWRTFAFARTYGQSGSTLGFRAVLISE